MQTTHINETEGELTLSLIPIPRDANMQGTIFGGWLLAQLDLAGAVPARRIAVKSNERVVTKAVNHVEFIAPIFVGDKVNFYTTVDRTGRTSISIHIEVTAERYTNGKVHKVAEAEFVYVRLPRLEPYSTS